MLISVCTVDHWAHCCPSLVYIVRDVYVSCNGATRCLCLSALPLSGDVTKSCFALLLLTALVGKLAPRMFTLLNMQLPANSNMALSIRAKAEAEEQERAEMKRLVLQAQQQEQFDYVPIPRIKQTLLGQGGPPVQSGSLNVAGASRGSHTRGSRGSRGG